MISLLRLGADPGRLANILVKQIGQGRRWLVLPAIMHPGRLELSNLVPPRVSLGSSLSNPAMRRLGAYQKTRDSILNCD